jgi:hypothetical protein
MLSKALKA